MNEISTDPRQAQGEISKDEAAGQQPGSTPPYGCCMGMAPVSQCECEEARKPKTLTGMIAAIYGSLDAEDCALVDREWMKYRGIGQPQSPWQPIETAPKDGTEIDLWCVNRSDGNTIRFPGMFWGEDDGCWQDWHSYLLEMKWRPTHWMAQPAGPSDTRPHREGK